MRVGECGEKERAYEVFAETCALCERGALWGGRRMEVGKDVLKNVAPAIPPLIPAAVIMGPTWLYPLKSPYAPAMLPVATAIASYVSATRADV